MAVDKIQNFNRIIDIYFLDELGQARTFFICPRKGRKPTIEMNGILYADGSIPAFNVTVKNLYLDTSRQQYNRIKIVAGYENNHVTIEGTILSIYQESASPEGTTVIQCQQGKLQDWLTATVQMEYDKGRSIQHILEKLNQALGTYGLRMTDRVKGLTLKEKFVFDGMARNAIEHLKKAFEDEKLVIFQRNNMLCAMCLEEDGYLEYHVLDFISAPPQANTGDESGSYYTTVKAPWEPKIGVGDWVEIPTWTYIKNFSLVNTNKGKQVIQVTSVQFQFGTTGGANNMTLQGFNVSV